MKINKSIGTVLIDSSSNNRFQNERKLKQSGQKEPSLLIPF